MKVPLAPNILALNAMIHHDMITLPMGLNQTVTTETLDTIDDTTSRIPVVGNIVKNVVRGFHNLFFGTGTGTGGKNVGRWEYPSGLIPYLANE